MSSQGSGASPELWTTRVAATALDTPCDQADEWCDAVASVMASGCGASAAVRCRDAEGRTLADGQSRDPSDSPDAELWERLAGSAEAADVYACAPYRSPIVRGDVCVVVSGAIGGVRSHVTLVAALLADIYRVRLAEPSARRAAILERLRPSQRPLVPLLATGMSQRDISRVLGKSPHTVHDHTKMIYRVLGVHSRVELASVWHGFRLGQPQPV